ncbi:MAG: HD-GYP domain-containing protein [Solirubrobacterales bacterium]
MTDHESTISPSELHERVEPLLGALETHDPGAREHATQCSEAAVAMAFALSLPMQDCLLIGAAARVHEAGNIYLLREDVHAGHGSEPDTRAGVVPDKTLAARRARRARKRRPWRRGPQSADVDAAGDVAALPRTSRDEYVVETSRELVVGAGLPRKAGDWVLHHRERFDGRGGPDGLAGEQIPLQARIIAVGCAFADLRIGRAGVEPLPAAEAVQELRKRAGGWVDPAVVEALAASAQL